MLLVTGALMYWFLKINFRFLFNDNLKGVPTDYLLKYFNNNYPLLIAVVVLFVLILLIVSLFNSSYPILYLKLIAEKNTNDFTAKDILSAFKQNIWKMFKFSFGLVFILFPVLVVTVLLLFFLCFVLIGFPLLIIAIPALFTFINFSFYSYLIQEKSFFQSLNHAYILLKKDFWAIIGATFIVMVIIQMIQGSITLFFYFVGIFIFLGTVLVNPNFDVKPVEDSPILLFTISLIFIILLAISTIFNNILVINQGIIYYSLDTENKTSTTDIDLIGSNDV
ncbi:hypothetical protein NJT12_10180 [Flavobacterium sp. AC]|uniref:Uncharacterized protein n=1 Tax=Flavobacterium azizsancarii TaxID=2961580 RepID=A0ABT4WBP0_9FLAO|nr:hypothetical protein [Flavobacterium azizsancarii]MDA6069983.1 hypothetical protein [Flavobacterium azizsancarii]